MHVVKNWLRIPKNAPYFLQFFSVMPFRIPLLANLVYFDNHRKLANLVQQVGQHKAFYFVAGPLFGVITGYVSSTLFTID